MMGEFFIEANEARLGYHQVPLPLPPLTFALPVNKVVALVGPNGAGKSTLLSTLVRGNPLLNGELFIGKQRRPINDVTAPELARLVAFIPQSPVYPTHLKVIETLKTAFLSQAGVFGALPNSEDPRILEALEGFTIARLGLKALRHLSAGERQRVFLARAFLQASEILLLDEPTSHLDPSGTRRLALTLQRAQSLKPRSVLVASHDLLFIEAVADWVLAIDDRGVFQCGALDAQGAHSLFAKFFAPA